MKFTKTTKKHFEMFKKEGEKWAERFGLADWRIEFFHLTPDNNVYQKNEGNSDARAWCNWKMEGRCAGIYLAAEWPEYELTDYAICQSAFHEVLHVLLGRLHLLSQMRFLDCTATIDEEVHTIIRRLENGVFNNEYKKTRRA